MLDQQFLTPATDVFGPLQGGERVMWRGRCGVAEYAFDKPASLPHWTLPETTQVLVTDQRVLYSHATDGSGEVTSGELRWLWPQHLRVQPGARSRDRGAAATQIQLVCGGADGSYPALVFAGGDLATVADADRMANTIRQAIARFRVDNADKLGLAPGQSRMLSRMLMGPEFRNHQGGEGQTVTIMGALPVNRPAPARVTAPPSPAVQVAAPVSAAPAEVERYEGTRLIDHRPGPAADAARALMAARAEEAAAQAAPDTASRAASIAARVASLISADQQEPVPDPARFEVPTTNLTSRAEAVRRTAARLAANSGRTRSAGRPVERHETGVTTRGNRNG